MAISEGTAPNAAEFDFDTPKFTYKGGKSPKSAVLSGIIESGLDEDVLPEPEEVFDRRDEDDKQTRLEDYDRIDRLYIDETFLATRRIGGTEINDRKIGGWKEVPIFEDWNSTYRHSEWFDNLEELSRRFEENGISGLIEQNPESDKDFKHNHAVCTFLNSYLVEQNIWKDNAWLFDEEQLFDLLKHRDVVKSHAKQIYIDEKYDSKDRIDAVYLNGRGIRLKYNDRKVVTYENLVSVWLDYLEIVSRMKVWLVEEYGKDVICIDPQHRWKEDYTNKMLAKFSDLEDSEFGEQSAALFSLTTYQDKLTGDLILPDEFEESHRGPSWFEAMERLKKSLELTIKSLRERARVLDKNLSYIWVFESHKTGYPHAHLAVFGDMARHLDCEYHNPDSNGEDLCDKFHRNDSEVYNKRYDYECSRSRTKDRLEYKYDLGHNGVAADIAVRLDNSSHAVNSIANYLMKYMKKNFGEIESKYNSEDLTDKEWGTLVYNAAMWLSGYRTWGTSRDVGAVMKTDRYETDKSFKNLGGEITTDDDRSYMKLVQSKASDEFKNRVKNRELLEAAIKNRKDISNAANMVQQS